MAYGYPYGNGQELNLDWFLAEWKNLLAAWEAEKNGIAGALDAEIAKAEAALADVFAARDAAAQSAANALESKNAAAQSASDASGYLATVRADANAARDAAQNAAQSEENALQSKNAAAQSEANALQSKNAAAQSAADADASKSAAAQSAADALVNKDAAAQSASDAKDAAESVEASAQQIATNTSDIAALNKSLDNMLLSPISVLTLEEYGEDTGISVAGRNITRTGNKFKTRGYSASTSYKSTNLFGTMGSVEGDGIPTTLTYAESLALPDVLSGLEVYAVCKYSLISGGGNVSRIKFYSIDENENSTLIGQRMMDGTSGIVMFKIDKTKHFNAVIWTRNAYKDYNFEISLVAYPELDTAALALALENN